MSEENKADATDYKTELETARAELAKKEKELGQARFTLAKRNVEDKKGKDGKIFETTREDDSDNQDADSIIDQRVEAKLAQRDAKDFLSKHSSNADEVELAKFHLEHSIVPTGNPEADAIAALAIANQKTFLKQKEELKAALLNKNQQNQSSSFSSSSSSSKMEVNEFGKYLTPEQLSTLRNTHHFNDNQIRTFISKKMGRP